MEVSQKHPCNGNADQSTGDDPDSRSGKHRHLKCDCETLTADSVKSDGSAKL
jgi:hypothetical protein